MLVVENELLVRFLRLDSAAVSDALDGLGLPSGFGGIVPMWECPRVVGFAATVQLAPVTAGAWVASHITTTAVAAAGPTDVLVVANAGRTDVSCWGGLLSLGAIRRGIRGVIADGACRDVREARDLRFPVFARAASPRTARDRLAQVSAGEPVRLQDVSVAAGDIVVADETGLAFVPRRRCEEVLVAAEHVVEREDAIAADLRAGSPLPRAMRNARLAGVRDRS
ncbi:MAG: dimethylmenaquinone methyltransferase [Pseudonocardiales bacterium]|nr:MAG: dimethylmenaquinone methyltransferase [Pseudonocardiales bacterium]